jgi:antitoxin CptB
MIALWLRLWHEVETRSGHMWMRSMTDSSPALDKRKRRIAFRAWHRGTREMDFILGTYVDARIGAMKAGELDRLEALMEIDDQTLYRWVAGALTPPAEYDTDVLAGLRRIRLTTGDFTR